MQTLIKLSTLTIMNVLFIQANAHDVWVTSPDNISSQDVLHADLSYSHDYPRSESIAPDRVKIFKPLVIFDANGKRIELKLESDNYHYVAPKKLNAGTYRIAATYQPTYWIQKQDGKWAQANLTNDPDAKYCEQTQMFGKRILTVDNKFDAKAAATPVGQELEIIPLANITDIPAGGLFPLQVLYQGKPLAGATVFATADTVIRQDMEAMNDHREINGYSAKTDKQGRVNFLPLVEGLWKVKVIHKTPFSNPKVCQHSALYATLIIPVGEERAKIDEHSEHHHHHY